MFKSIGNELGYPILFYGLILRSRLFIEMAGSIGGNYGWRSDDASAFGSFGGDDCSHLGSMGNENGSKRTVDGQQRTIW